jgi:hypothetical protein
MKPDAAKPKVEQERFNVDKVAQEKNTAQEKRTGCSRAVRDLPLERFRLPLDGRKWRVLARKRRALLLDISEYANGDGTFERTFPDRTEPMNYSPSEKRLLKHWAHGSLYRYQDDLRLLDLLDWDRPKHYHRRIYQITANAAYPFRPEHIPDNTSKIHKNTSEIGDEHIHDSPEQVRDSQEHIPQLEPTSVSYPSLSPSNPREREILYEWAKKQILGRAQNVLCPQAYLTKALPLFLKELPAEIENYLTHQLNRYVQNCMFTGPDLPIAYRELTNFLEALCDESCLPVETLDSGITDRILLAVEQKQSELIRCDPCGYLVAESYRTKRNQMSDVPSGWTKRRTYFAAYTPGQNAPLART